MRWSAEVVIVGSGVAGSLVAARLAKAGVKVLVLEAGPRVQRSEAFEQFRNALVKIPECPYPDRPYASRPKSDDPDHYFLQDGAVKFGGMPPSGCNWTIAAGRGRPARPSPPSARWCSRDCAAARSIARSRRTARARSTSPP